MKTLFKLTAIATVTIALTACGGGGGGSVSAPPIVVPPPVDDPALTPTPAPTPPPVAAPPVEPLPAPTPEPTPPSGELAWNQGQLNNASNTTSQNVDLLNSKFGTSNITAGTPDLNIEGGSKYLKPLWAHADVKTAFDQGWTGKGIGIQIIDGFNGSNSHGSIVQKIAQPIARGSYVSGNNIQANGTFVDPYIVGPARTTRIVNLSYGYQAIAGTPIDEQTARIAALNLYTGGPSPTSLTTAGMLITKSAGNGVAIESDLLNRALMDSASVIYVGNKAAAGGNQYTAAGSDATYQSKFLVVNAPHATSGGLLYAACPVGQSCTTGSSYAAPVVAGYAAIVMHKFNGITGAQTAQVLLNTADKGFTGYDVTIHGQGEASLSRALAPVGRLR